MEQKKINLSILFINIVFAIGVAFRSLINFFNGVGIAFVACLIIGGLGLAYGITKKENRRYLYDMFIMLGLVMIIQLIIFCSFDWALTISIELLKFEYVCCNILSVMSIIFLAYGFIRLLFELSNKKFILTEILLGLRPRVKKEKSNKAYKEKTNKSEKRMPKEILNGDFEDKPNDLGDNSQTQSGNENTDSFNSDSDVPNNENEENDLN